MVLFPDEFTVFFTEPVHVSLPILRLYVRKSEANAGLIINLEVPYYITCAFILSILWVINKQRNGRVNHAHFFVLPFELCFSFNVPTTSLDWSLSRIALQIGRTIAQSLLP